MKQNDRKPTQGDRHQEFNYKRLVGAALACCAILLAIYASLVYQRHVREDISQEHEAKMMAGDPATSYRDSEAAVDPAMAGNASVAGGANLDSDGSGTYAGQPPVPTTTQEVFDDITATIECLDGHNEVILTTFARTGLVPGEDYTIEAPKIDHLRPTESEIRGRVPGEDFTVTFKYFVPPKPIPTPKPTDEADKLLDPADTSTQSTPPVGELPDSTDAPSTTEGDAPKIIHTVEILCQDTDGNVLRGMEIRKYYAGQTLTIEAPAIEGYTPKSSTLTGLTIPGEDADQDFAPHFFGIGTSTIEMPDQSLLLAFLYKKDVEKDDGSQPMKAQTQLETPARGPIKQDEDPQKEMPDKMQTPPVNSSVNYGEGAGSQVKEDQTQVDTTPSRSDYHYQDPAGNIHAS